MDIGEFERVAGSNSYEVPELVVAMLLSLVYATLEGGPSETAEKTSLSLSLSISIYCKMWSVIVPMRLGVRGNEKYACL